MTRIGVLHFAWVPALAFSASCLGIGGPDLGTARGGNGGIAGITDGGFPKLDAKAEDAKAEDVDVNADANGGSCDAGPPPAVMGCASGQTLYDSYCYLPYQPTLDVSDSVVAPGSEVRVTWNGGVSSSTCAVSPWASAQSGSAVAVITQDTTFEMTCVDASGNYLSPEPSVSVHVETSPELAAYLGAKSALDEQRFAAWNQPSGIWEVEYDGHGIPANDRPMAFVWDNPIDDDDLSVYAAGRGFRFDEPETGLLTVDRHTDPADWIKGGVISRRDEFLNSAYGLTLEFRAKIEPDSGIYTDSYGTDHDAFRVHYQMETGVVLGLFLSPNKLEAGGYVLPNVSVPFDTTAFNTYRIVQNPGSSHFAVYVNDGTTPTLEADGTDLYPVGSVLDHEHPTIIIGGEGAYRAHFTLDDVRYRRGAFPPGSSIPPPLTRAPSPLPPPLPNCSVEAFEPGLDGTFLPKDGGPAFTAYGDGSGFKLMPNGVLELDESLGNTQTVVLPAAPGLADQGDFTLEARLRVMPDSDPRGFSLFASDNLGTWGLLLSPDAVEFSLGIKNVGYRDVGIQTAKLTTTDDFHVYRMVRRAHQLYAHLYVDDNPLPLIVDQHPDASMGLAAAGGMFIELGHEFTPSFPDGTPRLGHVQIDYIRWAPTAFGPPLGS